MNSKLFIITLLAALTAMVSASTSTSGDALVLKRAALSARMHARAVAGHGALKKRQPVDAGKERIKRAQYHPTRTAAAAPGMEKRQLGGFLGVGVTPVNVPGTGATVPSLCFDLFGQPLFLVGCPAKATASQTVCQATPKQQCNPKTAIAGAGSIGNVGSIGGVSPCCPLGFACSTISSNLGSSFCLTPSQLTIGNARTKGITFGSQQQLAEIINGL